MIRDQFTGYAAGRFHTLDEIRQHWVDFLARSGLEPVVDQRTVPAYVNDSRWVADCPECNGGILCAAANPHGCCLGCGHIYTVRWPDDAEVAVALLELRPRPQNRNWNAHQGEPIRALIDENDEKLKVH